VQGNSRKLPVPRHEACPNECPQMPASSRRQRTILRGSKVQTQKKAKNLTFTVFAGEAKPPALILAMFWLWLSNDAVGGIARRARLAKLWNFWPGQVGFFWPITVEQLEGEACQSARGEYAFLDSVEPGLPGDQKARRALPKVVADRGIHSTPSTGSEESRRSRLVDL
jgi:hypothetical protein